MTFKQNAVRAEPQIQAGFSTNAKSDSDSIVNTSDWSSVLIHILWSNGQEASLDFRVTHTDQASYVTRDPEKVLQFQEKERKKIKKYLLHCQDQRQRFTPFVFSVHGLVRVEVKNVLKQLSQHLTLKWQKPYLMVMSIVQTWNSIACI